ncbi:hypothetical protein LTR62_005628 [Meristemomyces frigidus]|uniref:Mannosyltransferase n=1 Tax=Meristemomyces frigidus TaxID=1508187 RepID=A0AAN7TPF4_9PEZI|nr:hypothetical protein LTR62_005628 [Meristemomyces frigidus]
MANVSRVQRPQPPPAISRVLSVPQLSYLATYVFLTLLLLRLLNAFVTRTFFQPDEYFQSLEPAWQLAFGSDSGAWITWEWRDALRSSIHPILLAGVYRMADGLSKLLPESPDRRALMLIAAPKIAQTVIAAVGDFFTWRLGCEVYGPKHLAAYATLALTAFSPWQFYCSTRTFSNSLETTLTVVALYLWPWKWAVQPEVPTQQAKQTLPSKHIDLDVKAMFGKVKSFLMDDDPIDATTTAQTAVNEKSPDDVPESLYDALYIAAVACILRPTNVIIWATIAGTVLYRYGSASRAILLAKAALVSGTFVLAISVAMDRAYYGHYVVPPVKFLYVNVVSAIAGFYGINRIDYYFTEGLPLLLTTAFPFVIAGMYQSFRQEKQDKPSLEGYEERQTRFVMVVTVLATVLTMTTIGHKEMRFIYPLLPILHVLAAKPFAAFFATVPANKLKLGVLLLMLTANIYIATYMTTIHQRGVVDVIHYLREQQETRLLPHFHEYADQLDLLASPNITVGFLMPCHSTPWRSHFVHEEIKAWALTCEPPLNLSVEQRLIYKDEGDIFYNHPAAWIEENLRSRDAILLAPRGGEGKGQVQARQGDAGKRAWPEFLVFFEQLAPVMGAVLEGTKYRECWRGFNTHWHDDERRKGDVVVWCMR